MSDPHDLPRSAEPRVSVLIPVRGGAGTIALLDACLRQLVRCAGEAPFETLVLLNEASAELTSWVARSVRGALILSSEVNLGIAGGLRLLRDHARGELLISLHQDAEVETGWLRALVATADARPDAGAVGSLVLEPDGVTAQSAGWILCADCATFPPWWGGATPTRAAFEGRSAFGVDYTPSSSLLVRAETWDASGGPDERLYPGYYVDVDLAMGIHSLDRSVLVEPRSVVRHHRGSATTQPFRSFVAARNRAIFQAKWTHLLERFVPRHEIDEDPVGGIARAVERAAATADRCRREWPRRDTRSESTTRIDAAPLDQALLERRCREHQRAVHSAYVAWLESRVAGLERELASRPPSLTAAPAGHQPP
jgi:GT2 family glycosyltransferase